MAEDNAAAPAAPEAAPAGGGGGNKIVTILTALNTVISIGVIVVLFLSHQKEKSKTTVEDIVAGRLKESDAAGGHGAAAGHGAAKSAGGHGGGHGEAAPASDEEDSDEVGVVMPLDLFTINLASGVGNGPRFVRINMSLEFEPGQKEEEAKSKLARIRDSIINILNSKKANELASHEGREALKDEIKRVLNSFLTLSKVKGIYFTNFQITN